ncbi:MAG: hypothetical protein HYX69_22900 [Planctomycetia bacterium]|nr:hypothetical protein [Planctomycetia bacterium]
MNIAIVVTAFALSAVGQNADAQAKVEAIFEAVETKVPPGTPRAVVQERFKKLAPAAGDDFRVRHAYIVALVHEKRYGEALQQAGELVKANPEYLHGQRLRAWLLLTLKKYPDALAALEALAKLIPAQEATSDDEVSCIEAAQFLGTAFGFLEGPGAAAVKEPVRTQYQTRILARVTGKRREAFDQQVQAVAELFANVRRDGEAAFIQAQKEKQETVQRIQKEEADLAQARSKSEADKNKQTDKLRKEWERLGQDLATLRDSFNDYSGQLVNLQNQRAIAAGQLSVLSNPQTDSKGNVPQNARDAYNAAAPGLMVVIGRLDGQITRLTFALDDVVRRGAATEARMSQLVAAGQRAGESFAVQDDLFGQEARKLAGREARAREKAAVVKPPKLGEKARTFNSYDEFLYESEKQRVLDALRDPS